MLGLLGACLVAVLLHTYHVWAAVAIAPDGGLFIEYARTLGEDPLAAVRSYDQHPLFPALIWLAHEPIRRFISEEPNAWICAGQTVALLGTLGAILGLYGFTSQIYGRHRGLIAAWILTLLPDASRFGADVLTDLPHLALYLLGLTAVLIGLRSGRARWLSAAAALSALAFLARPEGGAVFLVGIAGVLVRKGFSIKKRAALAVGMLALFFCITAPYQLATGKLVPKKSPLELFHFAQSDTPDVGGIIPAADGREPGKQLRTATTLPIPIDVARQWVRAGRVVYILLALLGLWVARPHGRRALVLGLAAGVHILLMHALEYRYGYLDRRHALLLATLSLPLAAAGSWWLSCWVAGRLKIASVSGANRVLVCIFGVCVVLTAYWLFRPINQGDDHVVAGGRWLAANTPRGTPIVADSRLRRVALYANRPFIEWRWWGGNPRFLEECLKEHSGGYFVADTLQITSSEKHGNPRFFEELDKRFSDRLQMVDREQPRPPAPKTELRIYRYLPK